jgi:hypothetical protein
MARIDASNIKQEEKRKNTRALEKDKIEQEVL